ncbi:MAG: NTP transferase domain-containing protein [Spirochaetia bacterium]|jgi:spore coat polysaccharide biosynthesis protein SpsF|nr:NTP transferase domain-containing protein [Spirochaetia bacterium]
MTGVFLQARLASTRLPRKALLPLAGKPLLLHAMESLKKIPAQVHALLTDPASAPELSPLARQTGFQLFVGAPTDVLDRYCAALSAFPVDTLIRATGDNPLVSWEMATRLLAQHRRLRADYSGYFGLPIGCGVEIVRPECLHLARRQSPDPYDHEHVTPYLYRNPQSFALHRPLAPKEFQSRHSLTVDTQSDLDRLIPLFAALYKGSPIPLKDLTEWIRSQEASHAE